MVASMMEMNWTLVVTGSIALVEAAAVDASGMLWTTSVADVLVSSSECATMGKTEQSQRNHRA
jgi:hypothetical protein